MKLKNQPDTNNLPTRIYEKPKIHPLIWILIILFPFSVILLNKIQPITRLEILILDKIKTLPCPIQVEDLNIKLLSFNIFPQLILENALIHPSCFKLLSSTLESNSNSNNQAPLNIDKLTFSLRGLGISPHLGLKLKSTLITPQSNINIITLFGFSETSFEFDETKINLGEFSPHLSPIPLEGILFIEGQFGIHKKQLNQIKFSMSVNELYLHSINIRQYGLTLPPLPLKNLFLKLNSDKAGKIRVEEFLLGETNQPKSKETPKNNSNEKPLIWAQLKGLMDLDAKNFSNSQLNLKGSFSISEDFLKKFSILNFILQKYPVKEGRYYIDIKGPLSRPNVSPL
jgi:hypothetical protein